MESLDFNVSWDANTCTVLLVKGNSKISITPGTQTAQINFVEGDVKLSMIQQNDKIYIDGSFFEKYADAVVSISADGRSATVTDDGGFSTRDALRSGEALAKEQYDYEFFEVMVEV